MNGDDVDGEHGAEREGVGLTLGRARTDNPSLSDLPLLAALDSVVTPGAFRAHLPHTQPAAWTTADFADLPLRALLDHSADGAYVLLGDRLVYANASFAELVGCSLDDLATGPVDLMDAFIPPEVRRGPLEAAALREEAWSSHHDVVAATTRRGHVEAQLSLSVVEHAGVSCILGLLQDVTERKTSERRLVRRNRELALLNDLLQAMNQGVAFRGVLERAGRRLGRVLGADGVAIGVFGADRRGFASRSSDGLASALARTVLDAPLEGDGPVASALRTGDVMLIADVTTDPRVALDELRVSHHGGALAFPLAPRVGQAVLGAGIVLLPHGTCPSEEDREFVLAVGAVLALALERAAKHEEERATARRMLVLSEVSGLLGATADLGAVADGVANAVHRLFSSERVILAHSDAEARAFVPFCVVDSAGPIEALVAIPHRNSIMLECMQRRTPVQRVRIHGDDTSVGLDPATNRVVMLLPLESELFAAGVGAAIAVPIVHQGSVLGVLWLGTAETTPLGTRDLDMLATLASRVALAETTAALRADVEAAWAAVHAAELKLAQNERVHEIGLIAHGVAHDFNNVLGAILGRAQLLKAQLLEPAQHKHADIIEKAAVDGAAIVRRISETGRSDVVDAFVPLDLDEIVADVVELTVPKWREQPKERGVEVELMVLTSPDAPCVAGNPHQLREVLTNLVHNAVDAMPEGGRLQLSTHTSEDVCEVRVVDTGTGIAAEVVARIFDPYFTTKGDRGTGLGLSVSASIARRHGGALLVETRTEGDEHGSDMILRLPRVAEPIGIVAPQAVRTERRRGHGVVLVIDDEENIREILCEILQDGDHEVITAADGAEGLHRLRERSDIDLVLTDLGLPGMSGYEVADAVKQIHPDLRVGLVTGWGATLDAEAARARGIDLIISKPFRYEHVLATVGEALRLRLRNP